MIELGLEKEVKGLADYAHLNALQTVGYSEWKDLFRAENKQGKSHRKYPTKHPPLRQTANDLV